MKNVTVIAYVSFKYPPNWDILNRNLRSQLPRFGYQLRQVNLGVYNQTTKNLWWLPVSYGNVVTVYLSAPNNASLSNIKNNVISILRAYGSISSSYSQLGEDIGSAQENNNQEVTVDENSVEAVEEPKEISSDNSAGIVLVGVGALLVYLFASE